MKNIVLVICLITSSFYANAEENKSNVSIVENFNIVSLPIQPLTLTEDIKISPNIIEKINDDGLHYIDSNLYTISKQNSEKIINSADVDCINNTGNKKECLSTRGYRLYQTYKMNSFIDGVYNQAKTNNINISNDQLFKGFENDINKKQNDSSHQPSLLSLIDEEDVKSNILLKIVSFNCMSKDKDSKIYMECLFNSIKNNNQNVFLNMKIKCLISTSEKNVNENDFSIFLQACINNEMLSDGMVKWIGFQSYIIGGVYFETFLNASLSKK